MWRLCAAAPPFVCLYLEERGSELFRISGALRAPVLGIVFP